MERETQQLRAHSERAALPALDAELTTIAGRYLVLSLLGAGGMGRVYKVRDTSLDELVALKVMLDDLARRADAFERFRSEVKLARRVTHPNVARVFDLGEHEGRHYFTMELIEGESLGAHLRRGSALPDAEVLRVGRGIADGLGAAHRAGVLHRDLKPDNIMLERSGRVVVTDFGIARALDASTGEPSNTLTGTPGFMAPEQLDGQPLDERSDVYALGVVLYLLIAGRMPWGDDRIGRARPTLARELRAARPGMPPGLAEAVARCLAIDPAARFPSMSALSAAAFAHDLDATAFAHAVTLASIEAPSTLRERVKTVAVLPFVNAGAADGALFVDGLAAELTDILSSVPGLRVRARSAVLAFAPGHDAIAAGRALEADLVVEGALARHHDRLTVTVRLIGVADGIQLRAARVECPIGSGLELNHRAAEMIAHSLELAPPQRADDQVADGRAVELYLGARAELRALSDEALVKAVVALEEAAQLAPASPSIVASLAYAHARRMFYGGPLDVARAAAEHALRIAPRHGEAHMASGAVHLQVGEVELAVRDLRTAVALAPALAEAHALLARLLGELVSPEAAILRSLLARELEPQLISTQTLARAYALVGRWGDAETALLASPGGTRMVTPFMTRIRLAGWARGIDGLFEALVYFEQTSPDLMTMLPQLRALDPVRRTFDPSHLAYRTSTAGERLRQWVAQIAAEWHLLFDPEEGRGPALDAIDDAVALGLTDLVWLDRCPVLTQLQAESRYRAARQTVWTRVAAARTMLLALE